MILSIFRRTLFFLASLLILLTASLVPVGKIFGLSQSDIDAINNGWVNWVDDSCVSGSGSVTAPAPGTGTPTGLSFPNLDPNGMATAINSFISKTNSSSLMSGLGSTVVASAQHSNVSPFFIIAIAHMESLLSSPSDFNVSHGGNSFGRTAAAGQPFFKGARNWYKWSSVKASVDYTAEENKNIGGGGDQASYMRNQFGTYIDSGASILTILTTGGYAPEGDGNNPSGYSASATTDISAMAALVPASSTSNSSSSTNATTTTNSTTSKVVWPFSTKSASQYKRVDQGWDMQTYPGGGVYAIAPGTIKQLSPDPGGFGNNYPVEQLDNSIGGPSDWIFYGHVHVIPSVVGKHVTAGQLIAYTSKSENENGSVSPAGWLEIGFAKPNTDAPFTPSQDGVSTPAGQKMHDILLGVNAGADLSASTSGTSNNSSCSTVCNQSSGGSIDKFLQAIALHESGGSPTANSGNGAYGKYQFIPATWQGYAKKYYPPGQHYATADLAPEVVQDAVAYLANLDSAKQFKNDPFWMAINWYQPSATSVYPDKNASSLNVAPAGNGGLTYATYGNQISGAVQTGTLEGKGPISTVKINYSGAPDFGSWLAKAGGAPTDQGSPTGSCGTASGNFVFYNQCDSKWANAHYDSTSSGNGTICANGCGATSVAEVVATLADSSVTPVESANYSMSVGGYIKGSGTSWSYFSAGPQHWGLHTTELGTDINKAISVLQGGGLVIAAGNGAAPFTSGGHVLVLKGIASNGDILVGDPDTEHTETQYSPSQIQSAGLRDLVGVTK